MMPHPSSHGAPEAQGWPRGGDMGWASRRWPGVPAWGCLCPHHRPVRVLHSRQRGPEVEDQLTPRWGFPGLPRGAQRHLKALRGEGGGRRVSQREAV